jgi:hypothetical protein
MNTKLKFMSRIFGKTYVRSENNRKVGSGSEKSLRIHNTGFFHCCASASGLDTSLIGSMVQTRNPDPDPGRQKIPPPPKKNSLILSFIELDVLKKEEFFFATLKSFLLYCIKFSVNNLFLK